MTRLDQMDRLHMTGHEDDEVEDCQVCGEPCTTHDSDDKPICRQCRIDRDAMQAESREER